MKNRFDPVEVLAVHRERADYGGPADILDLIDCATGKVVLSAGTENDDDYYPSFIANFTPGNMASNVGK